MFYCNGCEREKDDFSLLVIKKWGEGEPVFMYCRECRKPKSSVPDVYWDGKPEENLADDPITGKPRVFSCKSEKAAYLKDRGLMEAGDKVHGAPVSVSSFQNKPKVDSREAVESALREVAKMSPDYRRNEYRRIINQGRH